MSNVQPIIKWAGGKRKLAPKISTIVKEELQGCNHYVEPFFGGGALYFELFNNQLFTTADINDIVPQLVSFYKTIAKEENYLLIHKKVTFLIDEFNSLKTKEERTNFFSQIKGSFNDIWANKNNDYFENENEALLSAVLMYVLNKTCFNGLFRVNKKGEFNVPLGSYTSVSLPSSEDFKKYSEALKVAKIHFGDYELMLDAIVDAEHTFVYLDPPYVANSKTSDFTSYSRDKFKKNDQEDYEHYRLSNNFDKLVASGSKVLLSNHNNPKAVSIFVENKNNIFAYAINVTKTIGRVKGSTNSSGELLVSSFEIPLLKENLIKL